MVSHPEYSEASTITCSVAESSPEIERHDAVRLTGPREVSATDAGG
jgi:hypothetical protein